MEITINTIQPMRILKTLSIRGNENFDIPLEIVVDFSKIPIDKHELAYAIISQLYINSDESSEVKITWFDKLKNIFKGI